MIDDATVVAPPQPARSHPAGAVLVGAVDGLLGIALPFAVLVSLALLAWAGLGRPDEWTPYVGAAADVWLIGHGVDIRFAVQGAPFAVTAGALGPALVTVLCAGRAGRRAAATGSPLAAWIAQLVVTAGASAALVLTGTSAVATPVPWQGVALPVAVVVLGSLAGIRSARPGGRPLPGGVRAGLTAALLLIAVSALVLTALLFTRFADIVALDEALGAGPLGGLVLTGLQILAMPAFVVWTASWLVGAGVALGTGSMTGPFAGQVGPLPALPILGAVPVAPPAWAPAVLVLPMLAGCVAVVLARRGGTSTASVPLGAVAGLVAGVVLGALAAASAGAAGPGRFAAVGPDALLVAGLTAVLVGVPAMLAAAVVPPRSPPGRSGPPQ